MIDSEYFQAVQHIPAGHCRDTQGGGAEEMGCISLPGLVCSVTSNWLKDQGENNPFGSVERGKARGSMG